MTLVDASTAGIALAQVSAADDPIAAAQRAAADHSQAALFNDGAVASTVDSITAAQVLAASETTFPNLSADLENVELFRRAAADPSLRGNLRGRIAEEDWINRNAKDGWRSVGKRNAPQNDAWRRVGGKFEGAQVKVHADWHDYIRSMQEDYLAERFVVPDDHFRLVYRDLETRRLNAVRGGLTERASRYASEQQRLTKMGRTFAEVDGAIELSARQYGRFAKAVRAAGKAASFVGIALAVLDGGIAVYEVATGKAEVEELVKRLGKAAVGGTAAWIVGDAAAGAIVAAGASGAVPVAVAIIVGTATYLVIDWAIESAAKSLKVGYLTADDVKRVWPEGSRGVPLDRLYRKPDDPAILLKLATPAGE